MKDQFTNFEGRKSKRPHRELLVSMDDFAKMVGANKNTMRRLKGEYKDFPKPAMVTGKYKRSYYKLSELKEWHESTKST